MLTSMLPRLLAGILLFAALAPAQHGGSEEEQADRERMRREAKSERALKGGKDVGDQKASAEELERLTPEQRLARNIISGAGAYCRFHVAMKPAKLMPGQSGTLLITATLQGAAVLPSPPPVEMISPPQQGQVQLGAITVRPADVGRQLAPGYVGRPVYDNYAIFELPVTLASDAQIGTKYPVVVDLKFDLYDGASAQPLGRFLDRANAVIEAGIVLDPAVSMPVRLDSGGAAKEVAPEKPAAETSGEPARRAESTTIGGSRVAPAEATPLPPPTAPVSIVPNESTLPPVDDVEGGLPVLPIAIGGALVLAIMILLARRR